MFNLTDMQSHIAGACIATLVGVTLIYAGHAMTTDDEHTNDSRKVSIAATATATTTESGE